MFYLYIDKEHFGRYTDNCKSAVNMMTKAFAAEWLNTMCGEGR